MKNTKIIIDFDSTFVSVEGLEELALIALKDKPNKDEILSEIMRITNLGMEGRIGFNESLARRLRILEAKKEHVKETAKALKSKITPSIVRNRNFFKNNANDIYVLSGGFMEFMEPTLVSFGVRRNNILANTFVFDETESIIGFDESNFLSQAGGKVRALEVLGLDGDIVMIGDGWTDFEVKKEGVANKFIAFTENVKRNKVLENADFVVKNFDEVVRLVE